MLHETRHGILKEKIRTGKKEREKIEGKITRILADEELSAIKAMLEKDHAIDCMFLLFMNKGRWMEAKEFIGTIGKHIADNTFRARMMEIVDLELATRKNIGKHPNQYRYVITDFGEKLGELLLGFFDGFARARAIEENEKFREGDT